MKQQKITIEINKPKMTKLQEFYFSKLDTVQKFQYINTKQGKKNKYFDLHKFSSEYEEMKSKELDLKAKMMYQIDTWSPNNYNVLNKDVFYYGIEIECLIPKTPKIRNISTLIEFFEKTYKIRYLDIKDDGSLRTDQELRSNEDLDECPDCSCSYDSYQDHNGDTCCEEYFSSGQFGAEFVIMVPSNNPDNLIKLCKALNDLGATVNKSCGLHVHLDHRHLDAVLNAKKLDQCLEFFKTIIPTSRVKNTYCKFTKSNFKTHERYYAINRASYKRHQTIEVRLHSSTTQFVKIWNWCQMLKQIIDVPLSKTEIKDLGDLQDHLRTHKLGLERLELNYWQNRIAKFKSSEKSEESNFEESTNLEIGA